MQTSTRYALSRRLLHWLIALLVLGLLPIGLWMTSRSQADIWDALTDQLFGVHKAIGFTVLWLMVLRAFLRLRSGQPPYPLSMPKRLAYAASTLHMLLYILLLAVPLLGWAGVTAYPALITLAGYNLPAMPFVPQNADLSKQLFAIHGTLALVLGVLILGHIGAALKHLLINRDGIFQRMWFGK
jgi:cytochrome b561